MLFSRRTRLTARIMRSKPGEQTQRFLPDLHDGVMVIGSGQITHNLREADFSARPEDADPRVAEFTDWFDAHLAARDIDALLDYRRLAPHAALMHPTDEHLLPVFAALGAADDAYQLRIQPLGTYQRVLAMTNYVLADA